MNWLAHVYLSEPDFEFRMGNLLADFVRGPERSRMSPTFIRGTERHVVIDAFTDRHPIVRRSRARIQPQCRRFSGILVDIFYDHFLARRWPLYCREPFEQFTRSFYADMVACPMELPDDARTVVDHIVATDRFGAYREVSGIHGTLERFSRRLSEHWNKKVDLTMAVADLETGHDQFDSDFQEFFAELQERVRPTEAQRSTLD